MTPKYHTNTALVKFSSGLNLIAGAWLFLSAWFFAYSGLSAGNNWVLGAIVMVLAVLRISHPATVPWASWINCMLAFWIFASPWIYGYAGNLQCLISNFAVGIVVFTLGVESAMATRRMQRHLPPEPNWQ